MRKKTISTTAGPIVRLVCAALIVFAALPLAFGSSSAPKASSKIGDGAAAVAVLNAPGESPIGADTPSVASKPPADGEAVPSVPPATSSTVGASVSPNSDSPAANASDPTPDVVGSTPDASGSPDPQQDPSSAPVPSVGAGFEAALSLDGLVPASPPALLRAAALPPSPRAGFAWRFTSTGPTTCRIDNWNGVLPSGGAAGTVTVPATTVIDGVVKKVTAIQGSGFATYRNLTCHVDFSTGKNLQRIENSTFQQSNLKGSVDLPDSLTYLGQQSFQDCPNITSVKLPVNPGFTTIKDYTFMRTLNYTPSLSGTVTIPASVTSIGASAFRSNNITDLQFATGSNLSLISASAFQGNQIGGTITLPDSLATLTSKAFMDNRIVEVRFGKKPVFVGASCFENNRIAHDPIKGYKFSSLDARCFAGNLIDSVDFSGDQGAFPGDELLADNPVLTSAILSPSWARLPGGLFKGNSALVGVSFPPLAPGVRPALQRITTQAFQGCTSLKTIDFMDAPLQDSVNGPAIGAGAFQGCTSLEEVILGKKEVEFDPGFVRREFTVSADAFRDCTSLKTAVIPPAPSGTHVLYHIKDRAFMNTDLGDYASYPGAIPGVPLGTLPLNGREIVDIGAQAYQNANLKNVWLPSSLTSVGANAFADNHMGSLELPGNDALDAPGAVGSNILSGQTVKGSAFYGDVEGGKANVMVDALHSDFGIDVSSITSLTVRPTGGAPAVLPDNDDWTTTGKATFGLSDLDAPGASLNYGLNVWRKWGSGPLSTGDVTVPRIEAGVPFEFQFYDDADYSSFDRSFVQWVAEGSKPQEVLNGVPNFGTDKPGYHAQSGAYVTPGGPIPPGKVAGAGWKWESAPNTGTPVDPASVTAVKNTTPAFGNRWFSNSYSVSFDDNFAYMIGIDSSLGNPDPSNPGSFLPEPNPDLVFGSLPDVTGLVYGTPSALPANNPPASATDPQGTGLKMGAYQFVGWATSPDLPESRRLEGSNFFSPGSQIATPDPAPADGGTLTLYAQWKARDLTQDPLANGSIMIPARIQMQQDGAHLWSKAPAPSDLPGFPGAASLPAHAVPVWAERGGPGASWPAGIRYQVFLKRSAPGASLLSLACSDPEVDPATHAVDVLKTPEGAPYDPGPDAADPSAPLMELEPSDDSVVSGLFYLRTQDKPWDFAPNASYAATMTFVLKQVGP